MQQDLIAKTWTDMTGTWNATTGDIDPCPSWKRKSDAEAEWVSGDGSRYRRF